MMGRGKKREKPLRSEIFMGEILSRQKTRTREVYLDGDRSLSLGGCSFLPSLPPSVRLLASQKTKKKPQNKLFSNFNRLEAAGQRLGAPLQPHHFRARGSVLRAPSPTGLHSHLLNECLAKSQRGERPSISREGAA